jgi:hypothetical protein
LSAQEEVCNYVERMSFDSKHHAQPASLSGLLHHVNHLLEAVETKHLHVGLDSVLGAKIDALLQCRRRPVVRSFDPELAHRQIDGFEGQWLLRDPHHQEQPVRAQDIWSSGVRGDGIGKVDHRLAAFGGQVLFFFFFFLESGLFLSLCSHGL